LASNLEGRWDIVGDVFEFAAASFLKESDTRHPGIARQKLGFIEEV